MALQIDKVLDNGITAGYHVITDVHFSKRGTTLGIYWAGFKDKAFRDGNWNPETGGDNTDKAALYVDKLFITGQDFIDNILPYIDSAGARTICYQLLKDRVDYLTNAIDI